MTMASVSNANKSSVWSYFIISRSDKQYAECTLCNSKISRGGVGKKAGTSAMRNHLNGKHKNEFFETKPSRSKSTSTSHSLQQKPKQIASFESFPKEKTWDINDERAQQYHRLIAEMIALDDEPSSIVEEHLGFIRLINRALPRYQIPTGKYFTEVIIPDVYRRVVNKIQGSISSASSISMTIDTWTCDTTNSTGRLSFTAHWFSEIFHMKRAVLEIKRSTTGANITEDLSGIAKRWEIPRSKIHLVVHDNGANVGESGYTSARCFIHTLRLVINDSLKAQPEVTEMIKAGRKIVTYFNDATNQEKLGNIQNELGLPKHDLVRDVITRWNSTYYLLERLLEQKRAFSLVKNTTFDDLTDDQWELMRQCLWLLKPFEEITKITSRSNFPCISEVIPHVTTLLRCLNKDEVARKTRQVSRVRDSLMADLTERLDDLKRNENYSLATFLDPRFKTNFFNAYQAEKIREMISSKASIINESANGGDDEVSPEKREKFTCPNENEIHVSRTSFWDCYDEIVGEKTTSSSSEKNQISAELVSYLNLNAGGVAKNANPSEWWATNEMNYPILANLAKTYLSAPGSSARNERLFSEEGNAEEVVFLRHNLKLLNFEY